MGKISSFFRTTIIYFKRECEYFNILNYYTIPGQNSLKKGSHRVSVRFDDKIKGSKEIHHIKKKIRAIHQ